MRLQGDQHDGAEHGQTARSQEAVAADQGPLAQDRCEQADIDDMPETEGNDAQSLLQGFGAQDGFDTVPSRLQGQERISRRAQQQAGRQPAISTHPGQRAQQNDAGSLEHDIGGIGQADLEPVQEIQRAEQDRGDQYIVLGLCGIWSDELVEHGFPLVWKTLNCAVHEEKCVRHSCGAVAVGRRG